MNNQFNPHQPLTAKSAKIGRMPGRRLKKSRSFLIEE
jgi:hypothetical protein